MRVLFVTCPEKTFFQPMVPLAWALRTAGHEVLVAAQPSFAGEITDAGLTAVPVGRHGTNSIRRLAEIDPETENRDRAGLPPPYRAAVRHLDRETMTAGYRNVLTVWHKLNNFPLVTGLVEFARSWRPDLVIWEATTYAGAIAAEACGAVHGRMMWSLDVFGVARQHFLRLGAGEDPMAEWLAGYGRRYGFEFTEELVTGHFTIDALPASLHLRANLRYLPMRYVPYGGRAVVPEWLRVPADRPRVAITLGTSATEVFAGYTVSVQDILTALSDMDIEVVATVPEDGLRVPDNVRLVSYVPLHALAPTCAAVLNHAGFGTFLTTALHGVPQLTMPWDFDEPEIARRAAAQGAALNLDKVTEDSVRDHVHRLLTEPAFRRQAAHLRDEMLAMPTPDQLVGELEKL